MDKMQSKRGLKIKIIASYNIFNLGLLQIILELTSITAADTVSIGEILEGIKHYLANTKKYVYRTIEYFQS